MTRDDAVAGSLVVTDGTDNFYGSRGIFQYVYDFGDFGKITAFGSSTADSKKMLLSRNARYSGLLDVLEFAEGGAAELATAFGGADTWLAVNADEATVLEQLKAAEAAGVKRAFVHVSASEAPSMDVTAVSSALSSLKYTVMRTGSLSKTGGGGGLIVGEIDLPTCDEVPADDVFRFITEALTLPEAEGRAFSLCTSVDSSQLREMRMAGCSRREEVLAFLQGKISDKAVEAVAAEPTAEEAAATAKSEAEIAAAREEELKALLAKAKVRGEQIPIPSTIPFHSPCVSADLWDVSSACVQVRGEENQKKMAEEEAAKEKARAERMELYKSVEPEEGEGKEGEDKDGGEEDGKGSDDKPKKDGDDDKPKKDGDDDDDGEPHSASRTHEPLKSR